VTPGIRRVLEMLGRSWISLPRRRLVERIGEDAVAWLETTGIGQQAPLQVGDRYPCTMCAEPACTMWVVEDGASLAAVCGLTPEQCVEQQLPERDAVRIVVEPAGLVPYLQTGLRLPVRPWDDIGPTIYLGDRRIGSRGARFALVPQPRRLDDLAVRRLIAGADAERLLVLVTFTQATPHHDDPRIRWVALDERLLIEDGLIDLSAVVRTMEGVDAQALATELWPRYAFVVDVARDACFYRGQRIPLDRHPLEAQFLRLLLDQPGEFVPRAFLTASLWPGDPADDVILDRRLRQAKSVLGGLFDGEAAPLESLRTRSDGSGGYRVTVRPDQVLILR
jgi:hypothetical protein